MARLPYAKFPVAPPVAAAPLVPGIVSVVLEASLCRALCFPLPSSACRCRGLLAKLESSRKPPDRRTCCLRVAKSCSSTASRANGLSAPCDCEPLAPWRALLGPEVKLCRCELPSPLST
jgi:hypothetical protein